MTHFYESLLIYERANWKPLIAESLLNLGFAYAAMRNFQIIIN